MGVPVDFHSLPRPARITRAPADEAGYGNGCCQSAEIFGKPMALGEGVILIERQDVTIL